VMRKLARVARVVLNVCELCEKHKLNEEELPASLRAALVSLQRFVSPVPYKPGPCSLTVDQGAGSD
jgi:hypothetical protein